MTNLWLCRKWAGHVKIWTTQNYCRNWITNDLCIFRNIHFLENASFCFRIVYASFLPKVEVTILTNRVTKIELEKCEGLMRGSRGAWAAARCAGLRGRRHFGEGQRGRCVRFRRRAAARRGGSGGDDYWSQLRSLPHTAGATSLLDFLNVHCC